MAGSSLSLCMIVRDEEELLPRFLEHVDGLWDELVAVDTGSRDTTRDLLRSAGARVIERPWTDDFAEARNAGVAAARCAWIVVLDADEMVSAELRASLLELAADPRAGAVSLPFRDELPHGHVRESSLLRMFRSHPSVRFRHAVHEEVASSVSARLRATGLAHRVAAGHVDHLGYQRRRAEARGKRERDRAILRACLARDPGDVYSHLKLLEQCRFWNDTQEWRRAAGAAAGAAATAGLGVVTAEQAGELLVLIADGLHPADPRAGLAFLEAWAATAPPSAPYLLRRAELNEQVGRLDAAAADFEACSALGAPTEVRQLASTRPRMGLCRVAIARGELQRAEALARSVIAETPRDPEALLAAAALANGRGGASAVAEFAAEVRARHGPSAELAAALRELGAAG